VGIVGFPSCDDRQAQQSVDVENVITQMTDSLKIISSDNGQRKYIFTAPLMERYSLSKEPYIEFRKGINIESYDSAGAFSSSLVADYAIYLENQKLWQAKGNVVGINKDGQRLETQQLFWNQNTKRIYSNVDTRVTMPTGERVTGVGFESDEAMNDWVFRRPTGKVTIDTDPTDTPAPDAAGQPLVQPAPGAAGQPQVQPAAADQPAAQVDGHPVPQPSASAANHQGAPAAPAPQSASAPHPAAAGQPAPAAHTPAEAPHPAFSPAAPMPGRHLLGPQHHGRVPAGGNANQK